MQQIEKAHLFHCLRVQIRNAIPQNITFARTNQDGTLAYAELLSNNQYSSNSFKAIKDLTPRNDRYIPLALYTHGKHLHYARQAQSHCCMSHPGAAYAAL